MIVFLFSDPLTDERFWIVHGVIRDRPLVSGLASVAAFLSSSPDVVVWDSHSFERDVGNWEADTHAEYQVG